MKFFLIHLLLCILIVFHIPKYPFANSEIKSFLISYKKKTFIKSKMYQNTNKHIFQCDLLPSTFFSKRFRRKLYYVLFHQPKYLSFYFWRPSQNYKNIYNFVNVVKTVKYKNSFFKLHNEFCFYRQYIPANLSIKDKGLFR